MRILVTGASGLLGSKLVELALKRSHEVYSCYSSHSISIGYPVKLDISNKTEVSEAFRRVLPEVVVHAAALTDVDLCEKDKDLAFSINVEGTRNTVEAGEETGAYLVYVSTDYVFSGDKGRYREEDKCNPVNYYGYTKLEGEKIVRSSNLEYLIARSSVIYGSRPAVGKVNFALWVLERLRSGEEVPALVDQFVSSTLNTNLSEMILEAVDRRLTGVYHMSGASRVPAAAVVVKGMWWADVTERYKAGLVSAFDAKEFSETILELLNTKDFGQYVKGALDVVEKEYNWPKITENLLQVYEKLVC